MENIIKEKVDEILKKEDLLWWLVEQIQKKHVGNKHIMATHLLSACSSGLAYRPYLVNTYLIGNPSAGKSHLQNALVRLFPRKDVFTSLSTKAFVYKSASKQLSQNGVILFDESESLSRGCNVLMRVVTDMNEGIPKHGTVINGRYEEISVPEINSIMRNSCMLPNDSELVSRFWVMRIDESQEQQRKIQSHLLEQKRLTKEEECLLKEVIKRIISEPVNVVIPYRIKIAGNDRLQPRTLQKLLNLLRAIVYLTRFSNLTYKETTNTVTAKPEHFEILKEIVDKLDFLKKKLFLDEITEKILEYISDNERGVDIEEISKYMGESTSICRRRIESYLLEYVSVTRTAHGKYIYYPAKQAYQDVTIELEDETRKVIENAESQETGCVSGSI